MPELPEVETIARGLDKRVTGDRIESVWLGSKPEPLKSPPAEIVRTLEGKRIAGVRRVGKHIVFDLDGEPAATKKKANACSDQGTMDRPSRDDRTGGGLRAGQEEVAKHTHAILQLKSGRELRFVDPRRFGRLSVTQGFEAPGTEPLQVKLEKFVQLFKGRKTPIKSALLNQKLLSGVGNIYADESLFRAGIRPQATGGVTDSRRVAAPLSGCPRSIERSNRTGRFFDFRLR